MEAYFLPINSTSLAHYFGCACIKPARYFDNKPEDIQNKYSDFLLLTSKVGTQDTDCCLELYLSPQEETDLVPISDSWFLCKSFLPISRVLKIYLSSEEQKKKTITNVNMSTAFIPKQMVGETMSFSSEGTTQLPDKVDVEALDLTRQILQYDRFLGALALMRVAREDYMNVSENYVDTLSFFNTEIESQLKEVKEKICDKYIGLFSGESDYAKIRPYLDSVITEQNVEEIARKEGQTIWKDPITKVIDLSKLKKATYLVAFLHTFGVGAESKKKNIDEIIVNCFHSNEIDPKRAEGVAMSYGYNRGYSVFSNFYKLPSPNREVDVKFRMEDKLDLYVIESVFDYITNPDGSRVGKIEYIDKYVPEKKVGKLARNEYVILGTKIIGKKKGKVFSREYWEAFFKEFDWEVLELLKEFLEKIGGSGVLENFAIKVAEAAHRDIVEEEEEKHSQQIKELEDRFQKEKESLLLSIEELTKNNENLKSSIEGMKEQPDKKKEQKGSRKRKVSSPQKEKKEDQQESSEEAKEKLTTDNRLF